MSMRIDVKPSHSMPNEIHLTFSDFNTFKTTLFLTDEDMLALSVAIAQYYDPSYRAPE